MVDSRTANSLVRASHVAVAEADRDLSQAHVATLGREVLQRGGGAATVEGEAHGAAIGIALVADSAEGGRVGAHVVPRINMNSV